MEENKLKDISEGMAFNMSAEVSKGTSDPNIPLERALKLNKNKRKPTLKQPMPKVIEIDSHHIYDDPFTVLFFKLIKLNNAEIDKLLTEANFTMIDLDGKNLFPIPKNDISQKNITK